VQQLDLYDGKGGVIRNESFHWLRGLPTGNSRKRGRASYNIRRSRIARERGSVTIGSLLIVKGGKISSGWMFSGLPKLKRG